MSKKLNQPKKYKKCIYMKRIVCYLILFVNMSAIPAAATDLNGAWEGYPPMTEMTDVVEFGGKIYGTTSSGMFSYDSEIREFTYYYKNQGIDVSDALCISATSKEIFVGFEFDGLMRFDPKNGTFEPVLFPEYVDKDDVLNTIAVRDIYALNDSILFVGHSKGIDRLNLSSEELRTFSKLSSGINADTPVNEVDIFYGKIWACTNEGLAWADVNNPNLESERAWDSFSFNRVVNCVEDFIYENSDSVMYVGTNGRGLFAFDSKTKAYMNIEIDDINVYDISKGMGTYFLATYGGLYKLSADLWIRNSDVIRLSAVIEGSEGKMWIASSDGLKCFISSGYWGLPQMNLPRTPEQRDMSLSEKSELWIATSYRDAGGYLLRLRDGEWESYGPEDDLPSFRTTTVTVDNNGIVWGGTWDRGIYTIDSHRSSQKFDDIITLVDPEMEIIQRQGNSGNYVVISDITTDAQGNIWVAGFNKGAYALEGILPINQYNHHHFTFEGGSSTNYIINVFPDNEGWLWLGTWDTGLIGVYYGPDPYDPSDDVVQTITSADGLKGTRVLSVDIDSEGYVWVGTLGGLHRITKKSDKSLNVIEMNTNLEQISIDVNSIAIDKDDSKWIGTSKGLYKLNAGNVLEETYTVENSGLLSDSILSLEIDENEEYLWIGTTMGLNRLALSGGPADGIAADFHMYPNPFEIWGDNSQAVFTNLDPDEPVFVYTFTGELVIELDPDDTVGTSAVWNGRNFRGEFVGSGVYFFTGVDRNGSIFKEKMVVIRR